MNEELMQKLMQSNQEAIRTLGNQIEDLKKKLERDQEDYLPDAKIANLTNLTNLIQESQNQE